MIGTPTEEDMKFVNRDEAKRYLKHFKPCEPIDLGDKYPAVEHEGIKLLKKMLKFNPNERISALDAIKDPYFDDIRLPEQEEFEECDIDLSFIDKY